jgi:AraC-like DNA-binding protein
MDKTNAHSFKPYFMPLSKQDIMYIRQAKAILDENFDKHITIPQLARQTGINEAKLKEGFKELFNFSVHTYLQQLRLEKAKQLLLTTNMPITDITYHIGYSHVTHFTSLFKKEFGVTPGEYRKKPPLPPKGEV